MLVAGLWPKLSSHALLSADTDAVEIAEAFDADELIVGKCHIGGAVFGFVSLDAALIQASSHSVNKKVFLFDIPRLTPRHTIQSQAARL
jgi:hypothetical protein